MTPAEIEEVASFLASDHSVRTSASAEAIAFALRIRFGERPSPMVYSAKATDGVHVAEAEYTSGRLSVRLDDGSWCTVNTGGSPSARWAAERIRERARAYQSPIYRSTLALAELGKLRADECNEIARWIEDGAP